MPDNEEQNEDEQKSRKFTAVNTLLIKAERSKKGGFAKVKFQLTAKVTKALGWPEMPEGTAEWCPDVDEIRATLIVLTPNNEELADSVVSVDTSSMSGFDVVRKAKKAGKNSVKAEKMITEVLCKINFDDPLGAAKLEQYILSVGGKRAEMLVHYTPQPVQEELPGTRVDVATGETHGEVVADPEAQQRILEGIGEEVQEGPGLTAAEKKAERAEEEKKKAAAKKKAK